MPANTFLEQFLNCRCAVCIFKTSEDLIVFYGGLVYLVFANEFYSESQLHDFSSRTPSPVYSVHDAEPSIGSCDSVSLGGLRS
jgi:hypothetical protein